METGSRRILVVLDLCSCCFRLLPSEAFTFRFRGEVWSRNSWCKDCTNNYRRQKRKVDAISFRAKQRIYYRKRRDMFLQNASEWQQKNPEKVKAKNRANYALRTGEIEKLPCQICGNLKSEMHHPDYTQPYMVIFLCHRHHAMLH
jgi:hypothetical protein